MTIARKKADFTYEVIKSNKRNTADIVIERDGRVFIRAPSKISDRKIEDIVTSKLYWIYKNLAEWKELNAASVSREYKNGEGFLYLGRAYHLSLEAKQNEDLLLRNGRFYLRRSLVESHDLYDAKNAFKDF